MKNDKVMQNIFYWESAKTVWLGTGKHYKKSDVTDYLRSIYDYVQDYSKYTDLTNITPRADGWNKDKRKSAIDALIDLQVLTVFNRHYTFTTDKYGKNGKTRTYNVNTYAFNRLSDLLKLNLHLDDKQKELFVPENPVKHKLNNISFRCYKTKEDNYLKEVSDQDILVQLYEKYPMIRDMQEREQYLNENYFDMTPAPSHITPNITRSEDGSVEKIGIREYNKLCSINKKKKSGSYINSRESILDGFFDGNYCELDIKGSVPRLLHILNTGEWIDFDVDPYKEIFEVNGFECTGDNRKYCKLLFMLLYFGNEFRPYYFKHEAMTSVNWETIRPSEFIETNKDLIPIWKQRVDEYCGTHQSKDTSIFLYESYIYQKVREQLITNGIKCGQVYDCFYLPEGHEELFYNIVLEQIISTCRILNNQKNLLAV